MGWWVAASNGYKGQAQARPRQAKGEVKDLGVGHGTTPKALVATRGRWHECCARLGRIARLPVGPRWAGLLAGASAMGAGAYAVAARVAPKDLLEGMRHSRRHISEPTRQAEISYAVCCLKTNTTTG